MKHQSAPSGTGRARKRTPRRLLTISTAATLTLLSTPGAAFADNVQNDVVVNGTDTIFSGGSTTVSYRITATNGDGEIGCNATLASPATVTVNAPSGVTVSPASRSFTACGVFQPFTFSSATPGNHVVTVAVSDSGPGTYNTNPAGFTLKVLTPPNTAPSVSVTGVTQGAAYEHGNVPAAVCSVTDAEDGPSSFAASLSAITGTRAGAGLGSQTANCSYTDRGPGPITRTASATYSIVDTTAPVLSVTPPGATEATGPRTSVAFGATATDSVDGSRPVSCQTASGAAYASGDGFAVGTTTLTCSATDVEGNRAVSDPFDVVVTDTTAPVVSTSANLVVPNTSGAGAEVSYDAASATDLVDGALTPVCLPAPGSTFPVGSTTVTCSATDAAGNTGEASFTVEVQDRTKPVVTVPATIVAEATGPAGAHIDLPEATADDDVDGPLDPVCDAASGVFALGTTTVTCSATDRAGNVGDSSFHVTVQDTTAPALSLPRLITEEATSSAGAAASYAASATDLVDGDVEVDCSLPSGTTFPLGGTEVLCSAVDAAGNESSGSFTVLVQDTTAPELTVPGDEVAEATGPGGARVDFVAASATDVVDGAVTPVCDWAPNSEFPLGSTTVTCTATDGAGNSSEASFDVRVVDTTAPEVTTPANLVVGNTSPRGADGVQYGAATATDLVDGTMDATCDPAAGGYFPLGTTTVTCTATDAAGNTGTGTFVVEVQDQTRPTVTVPADLTAEATGPRGAEVSFVGVTAQDDVDGEIDPTCDAASGDWFPVGSTKVTCSATDIAGNAGDNFFTVTVKDTTAPVVSVSHAVNAVATSSQGARVGYAVPIAHDLVDGDVAVTCDRAAGSMFPLGTTTVTCSATDRAGNTGWTSFTVSVGTDWSGVLQPINRDGSSAFKLGSTVPVKFALTGASAGIRDLQARLLYRRVGSAGTAAFEQAVSTSAATTGNLFRYDATERQYIFNFSTKALSPGTYVLCVETGDGVYRSVNVTLR